jgi:LacI family transcriptional regulator
MLQLPKRTSLAHETAASLKQWIASGLLEHVLPGELELKERLRVGRDTLRLALQVLVDEGWLEPSAQGRKRRIRADKLPQLKQSAEAALPVTFLSPYPIDLGQTQMEMEDTQKRLAERGREIQHVSPDIFQLKDPQRHLEDLVHSHPSAAWILHGSSQPIQTWFARRSLPALIYGWPYPGVDLPYVTKDWEPAGFHAGLQLLRHGHRTIGMFEFVGGGAGARLLEAGLRRAMVTHGNKAKFLLFKDERTPESIARAYEAAFRLKERPTALVLTSSNHLLTSLSWLVSKGLAVPRDVSLIVLPYDIWYADLYPPVSCYRLNTKTFSHGMADRVLELIEHGRVIRKSLVVPVDFVPGATIGPAPHPAGSG